MFYIKEGVTFEVVGNSSYEGILVSTIKLRLRKQKWASINNILCIISFSFFSYYLY